MKISIITAYYPPQQSAGANRLLSFATGFLKAGCEVFVTAPTFNDGTLSSTYHVPQSDLIKVTRIIVKKNCPQSFLRRFVWETITACRMLQAARRSDVDYFIVTTPYLSFAILYIFFLPTKKTVDSSTKCNAV
jgi:hypothetical protein